MSDVVGWVAGPTERGTLQLIWSCLITIFACTWTVLHLNVPAYDDKPRTILLRKIKWMVITILFPEFILSKAICDLRLALYQLLEFEAYLRECNKKITWTTYEVRESAMFELRWSWKVETPAGWSSFLYHLFRLPRTPSLQPEATQSNIISSSEPSFENAVPLTGVKTNDPATCVEEEQLPSVKAHPQRERDRHEEESQMPGDAEDEQWRSLEIPRASPKEHQLYSLKGDTCDMIAAPQERDRLGIEECDVERRPTIRDRQGVATESQITFSQEESTRLPQTHDFPEETFQIPREQKWTITHSYYAQMGGLLYFDARREGLNVMTASKFTRQHTSSWSWETEPEDEHPIRNLILGKDDIEDKSKADWFLKTLAILQVTWIILNTIMRHFTKLPVTQLEIASVAFAIMAVLTYLANWWKPKDVSQTTLLQFTGYQDYDYSNLDKSPDHLQSFMHRLKEPADAARHACVRELFGCKRVKNDIVWLEGETPLLFYLIAGSSFIFGGLHCLAWNFEFPTRAELICWRVASVTSAVLPAIALAISVFMSYLAGSYLGNKFEAEWLAELKSRCSDPILAEWWNLFLEPHVWSPDWDKAALDDLNLRPAEPLNREELSLLEYPHVRMAFVRIEGARFQLFKDQLAGFSKSLATCRSGTASPNDWKWLGQKSFGGPAAKVMHLLLNYPQLLKVWLGHENFAKSKLRGLNPPTLGGDTGTHLEEIFNITWKTAATAKIFQSRCKSASKSISDMSIILYAASRLILFVIVFTSLRAALAGVYQNTTWTRFLPSFS